MPEPYLAFSIAVLAVFLYGAVALYLMGLDE